MSEEENLNENVVIPEEKTSKRLRWIDQARGFVMMYLVISAGIPGDLIKEIPFLVYLLDHPGTTATTMNLFDIGTPAFLFIIGLSMSISFWRRAEKESVGNAVLRTFIRFFLILLMGEFLQIGLNGWDLWELIELKDLGSGQMAWVVWWDVPQAIGMVGIMAIPFILIKSPKIRAIAAYCWMLLYQLLFYTTNLRAYAIKSVHGGIFGSLYTFTSVAVIGTALGDYMLHNKTDIKKKLLNMGILGVINLALGIGLGYLPEWYWNKRQATFTYGMVSIGVIILALCLFVYLSEILKFKGKALVAFGMNPFLTYLVTELLIQLPDELDLFDMFGDAANWGKLGWGIIVFLLMGLMNWLLYRKRKTVKTEYATLGFFVIIFLLSFVL